jgi:hypothetical protein
MNPLNNPKAPIILLVVILLMTTLSTCNSCSTSKKINRLKNEVDSLQVVVSKRPTTEDVQLLTKIEGLRSSKRTLYDWNAVVRTAVRPDDRMNEYDQEIKSLEK